MIIVELKKFYEKNSQNILAGNKNDISLHRFSGKQMSSVAKI